jgi:hypothetical protein
MSDMIILFILNYLSPQVVCGDTVSVVVTVQRESDEEEEDEAEDKDSTVGRVVCPRYGLEKTDSNSNALLSIKRITIGEKPSKVLTTALIAHSVEPH